jgi:hypothetical protein
MITSHRRVIARIKATVTWGEVLVKMQISEDWS